MRDYKFRGKAKMSIEELDAMHFKHNDGWVVGNLIVNGNTPFIVGDILESDPEYIIHDFWLQVHPETVGEYTGFKDKKGKEIYEGDIVYSDEYDKNFSIEYARDWSCFAYNSTLSILNRILNMDRALLETEVIGNIYENPELLEQSS